MRLEAPQIIMIVWLALTVGISVYKNEKPKNMKYSANTAVIITALLAALLAALLYWGGFWT